MGQQFQTEPHDFQERETEYTGPVTVTRLEFRGRPISVVRPADPDRLLDDPLVRQWNQRDDYMPYWAYLWPGALFLAEDDAVDEAVRALRWRPDELDPELPPRIAFGGARHLILAAATRRRLAGLDYEFERLKALMLELELTTVDLVWRERDDLYHVRNPFPVGGVYEDPATGAAAAAFGGYLRALGLVATPARVSVLQGQDMGRPSVIVIDIGPGGGGIRVTGGAVPIA